MNRWFFFVFLFPLVINAQSLIDLYLDYIPDSLLIGPQNQEHVERMLENYGQLDPDLIYFYLINLHLIHEQKLKDPDDNLTILLKLKTAKAQRLKKEWARVSTGILISTYKYSALIKKIKSYYKNYQYNLKPVFYQGNKFTVNENLQSYFKYIYHSRAIEKFDEAIDYKNKYYEVIKMEVSYYQSLYSQDKQLQGNEIERIVDIALKRSFIFKGTYLKSLPVTCDFYLFDLIYKLYSEKYRPRSILSVQMPLEIVPNNRIEKYGFSDPMQFSYKYFYKFKIHNSLFANMALQLKIKERLTPGAFVRLSFGYTVYQNSMSTFTDTTIFSGFRASPGLGFEGEYILYGARNFKSFGINTQISAPVHYFSRKFYIEAGLAYSYQNLQFEFDFTKPGTVTNLLEESNPFFDDEQIAVDKHYHNIHPVVALSYELGQQFNFRLDYLFPVYISIGLSVNYNL